ncbi:AbrB/MazE/SpoVT family DNA-binding domain-containing protein [Acidithiobacillus sulfuriphilus]|uniref:Uncharacterized protein n=1 Tax=Acidithiobacillus sulfuriphilus TaxID=1867749 RepID=A0ACD5HM78_9PROT|nr:antitoxin [Acidithiobacillus sulfuriphilus]
MAKTTFRALGGSLTLTIPKAVAETIHAKPGVVADLSVDDGRLIISPRQRPHYALADLLAECRELPMDKEWDATPPTGKEAW